MRVKILFFIFLISIFGFVESYLLASKNFLKVSFLDIGQGDSILVTTPKHAHILFDGGRDNTTLTRLGENLNFLEKDIDVVIATHEDGDHITGLLEVLQNYRVKILVTSFKNKPATPLAKKLLEIAASKHIKIIQVDHPFNFTTNDGVVFKILFPIQNMDGGDTNSHSVVTQIIFNQNKFLLTGDLPQAGELFLVSEYGGSLQSDILKLGHHGSDTSSNAEFMRIVHPEIVIVSSGKNNSFGHPHRSVLDLCEKFGIKVFRTDEMGTINIVSDGKNFWRE